MNLWIYETNSHQEGRIPCNPNAGVRYSIWTSISSYNLNKIKCQYWCLQNKLAIVIATRKGQGGSFNTYRKQVDKQKLQSPSKVLGETQPQFRNQEMFLFFPIFCTDIGRKVCEYIVLHCFGFLVLFCLLCIPVVPFT